MTRRANEARVCSPPDIAAGRLGPLGPGEAEAAQRRVHALVQGVAAEDLELVLEVRVGRLGDAAFALERRERLGHPLEMGRPAPDRRAQVRGGHEHLVEMRLLGEEPEREAALPDDLAAIRFVASGREPEQRRLAGAVGTDQADPIAGRQGDVDLVEDDERPHLSGDFAEPQERHQAVPGRSRPSPGRPRGGWPRRVSCAPSARGPSPAPPRPG